MQVLIVEDRLAVLAEGGGGVGVQNGCCVVLSGGRREEGGVLLLARIMIHVPHCPIIKIIWLLKTRRVK